MDEEETWMQKAETQQKPFIWLCQAMQSPIKKKSEIYCKKKKQNYAVIKISWRFLKTLISTLLFPTAKTLKNSLSEQNCKNKLTFCWGVYLYAYARRLIYVVIETNCCASFLRFVHWNWTQTLVKFQKSQILYTGTWIIFFLESDKNPSLKSHCIRDCFNLASPTFQSSSIMLSRNNISQHTQDF